MVAVGVRRIDFEYYGLRCVAHKADAHPSLSLWRVLKQIQLNFNATPDAINLRCREIIDHGDSVEAIWVADRKVVDEDVDNT